MGRHPALDEASRDLLNAYGEAIRRHDRLPDVVNKAVVREVVASSARAAAAYAAARFPDNPEAVSRIKAYSDSVNQAGWLEQAMTEILRAWRERVVTAVVTGTFMGITAGIVRLGYSYLSAWLAGASGAGEQLGVALAKLSIPAVLLGYAGRWLMSNAGRAQEGAAAAAKGVAAAIGRIAAGPQAARQVVTDTFDGPERRLYALTGASPPGRPALVLPGPVAAGICVAIVGLVALTVLALMVGLFGGYEGARRSY